MTEHVGRVVGGRYRLLAPLGSGASAEVYLADDVRLRRQVAVKVLHTALADDESFLRRFRAEARAAAALSHPNILAIFDWNGDELPPYIVTEYLAGGSLRSVLDAGQRLTLSQALLVGLEAAQALDHAHRQGFVHRDIKPANLLFGGEARLRIADFGLARAIAEAGWTEPTGAVLGTARYASPEQARGESLDGRSDVYSLALLLIEAVTGTVPFTADTTIGTLMARLDRPLEVPDALGPLAPIIERAGEIDPADRPDAATFGNDLVAAATQLPRPAPLVLAGATRGLGVNGGPDSVESDSDRTMLHARSTDGSGDDTTTVVHQANPTTSATALAQIPDSTERMGRPPHPSNPGQPAALPPAPKLAPTARAARLRSWIIYGAVAVIAIALGVAGALFFQQSRLPTHLVPQKLVGMQKADVNDVVGGFGWRIRVQEVHRGGSEAGVVLDTKPKPGSKLREGSTLTLVVSLGPPLVDVPGQDKVAGLTQDEATSVLSAPGLELVAQFVPTESNDVEQGKVIGFSDDTPAQVPKGSTVKVLVSNGPPGPKIPDMEGWDFDHARQQLEQMGLQVEVSTEPNDNFGEGKVVRSEPGFGSTVQEGSSVTLVLSQGNGPIKVPNVVGRRVDAAQRLLARRSLVVGTIHGSQDGQVFATTPLPDSEVDPGTSVDLWTW
jgi:serine/threonine protein kinase/beta-lactam-binding protein with PASTA domain